MKSKLDMNLGTVSYLPPPNRFNSDSFLANLTRWKTRYPLYLYSDVARKDMDLNLIANPEVTKNPRRPWTINNTCFLFGLKVAMDAGLDYFLYLESDCRVRGDEWDGKMFDELKPDTLLCGSPIVYNPSVSGDSVLKKCVTMAKECQDRAGYGLPFYGRWPGVIESVCLYPNGAGGIYKTDAIAKCFNGFSNDIGRMASSITAWDLAIGRAMWAEHKEDLFQRFVISTVSYSGYGSSLVSDEERKNMLLSGNKALIHQWKGSESFV